MNLEEDGMTNVNEKWTPRPEQVPPPGDWATWLIVGSRASGKSRTAAEYILGESHAGRAKWVGLRNVSSAESDTLLGLKSGDDALPGGAAVESFGSPRSNYDIAWINGAGVDSHAGWQWEARRLVITTGIGPDVLRLIPTLLERGRLVVSRLTFKENAANLHPATLLALAEGATAGSWGEWGDE